MLIYDRNFNKRTVAKAEEILREPFTPKLSWKDKVILVNKVDEWKKTHHKDWTTERTSEYLGINYHYVLDSLRLYNGLREYPNLALVKNRKIAGEILRAESPFATLEQYLSDNNISTMSLSVDE